MTRVERLLERQRRGERLKFLCFWGHTGQGAGPWVLSQWFEAPFTVEGVRYPTAEHWMMAEKARIFGDDAALAQILAARTPGEAKALGRSVRDFDDHEWNRRRFAVVLGGSLEKFRQHPELAAWLLATGDRVLVEASPRDRVWGIGRGASGAEDVATWRGQNLLGFALGEARDRLRRPRIAAPPPGAVLPPWLAFPGVHPYELHWRMGSGESHGMAFQAWWETLSAEARLDVEDLWPARGAWSGWYDEEAESG
jgi:ribA/ribD-fused uncharacterized protein